MISMALDRLVAIKYPFTHRNYTSRRTAAIIASVAVIAGYAITSGGDAQYLKHNSFKNSSSIKNIFLVKFFDLLRYNKVKSAPWKLKTFFSGIKKSLIF